MRPDSVARLDSASGATARVALLKSLIDSGWLAVRCFLFIKSGEVPRGEKMLYSGTDPVSYITEYTLVFLKQLSRTKPLEARKMRIFNVGSLNLY